MKFFNFGKKENKAGPMPVVGLQPIPAQEAALNVKILGSGCSKCALLEEHAKKALEELALPYTLEHVRDYVEIAAYGVMSTPALVINEKVIFSGRVVSQKDISAALKKLSA